MICSLASGESSFICVKAFTGAVPFGDKPPRAAMLATVGGQRPPRPTHPTLTDGLWVLMQRCWDQEVHLRPNALEVLRILHGLSVIVLNHVSLV